MGQLHHDTIQMVKATSQAKFADKLLPLLTEEELETCFRCFAVFGENMDRLSGSRKATKGDVK